MFKYLGDHVTEEQQKQIENGTFNGIEKYDYWTINGYTWRITGFNRPQNEDYEIKTHTVTVDKIPDWMKKYVDKLD